MCREKALVPFDAVSGAANMRSDHPQAFVHSLSGPWTSAPCLTLAGTSGAGFCSCSGLHASTFLSPFPQDGFASRPFSESLRNGTIETLTPAQLTYHADLPVYLATSSCRSVSHPLDCLYISSPTTPACPSILGLRLRIAGSSQLPAESSSLPYGPTVRLRLLPTSPRGNAVTFGYGAVAYSDHDFHRANVAPSQAHSFPHACSGNPENARTGSPLKADQG